MIAGVQVNQSDGAPGGGISIQIRGTNSFSTNSQPLYIVDGVPFVREIPQPVTQITVRINQTHWHLSIRTTFRVLMS